MAGGRGQRCLRVDFEAEGGCWRFVKPFRMVSYFSKVRRETQITEVINKPAATDPQDWGAPRGSASPAISLRAVMSGVTCHLSSGPSPFHLDTTRSPRGPRHGPHSAVRCWGRWGRDAVLGRPPTSPPPTMCPLCWLEARGTSAPTTWLIRVIPCEWPAVPSCDREGLLDGAILW